MIRVDEGPRGTTVVGPGHGNTLTWSQARPPPTSPRDLRQLSPAVSLTSVILVILVTLRLSCQFFCARNSNQRRSRVMNLDSLSAWTMKWTNCLYQRRRVRSGVPAAAHWQALSCSSAFDTVLVAANPVWKKNHHAVLISNITHGSMQTDRRSAHYRSFCSKVCSRPRPPPRSSTTYLSSEIMHNDLFPPLPPRYLRQPQRVAVLWSECALKILRIIMFLFANLYFALPRIPLKVCIKQRIHPEACVFAYFPSLPYPM